ncbi:PREDICTED: uncharacterized protein LOC104610449 [Nelumbo nucifera]|uniref:Uncharacterized protein LOC104610449 n=1 Tax=Nelumbo nucifera TaxID=4432 RepID=A0A1U8BF43_NELNU|nr:PREDICTED: uncharacterized protein LOC104610449 [Nelumbo nucifera]
MQAIPERAHDYGLENQLREQFQQHVIVMRHGDRIDNFQPLWVATASRPWDPPLTDTGKTRAFCTGRKLRKNLGFPIHRVFVSPFLRCIQTAAEAVSALCAVQDNPLNMTSENVAVDPSKLKVSIEYGLSEVLCREAIRPTLAPKDEKFVFDISKLEGMFPAGTVDRSVERVYQEMPKWEESVMAARARYERVICALADKFPRENLLLVTHGEGVGVSISAFLKDATVYEVEYCAYAHTQRPITFNTSQTFTAGNFKVCTRNTDSGICYGLSGYY